MKYVALFIASIACANYALADQILGKVRICHYPGLTELMDKHSIPLKKGDKFVSFSDDASTTYYWVTLLEDATVPPKPKCVIVSTEATDILPGYKITPKSRRGVLSGNLPPGTTLAATPIEIFKGQ